MTKITQQNYVNILLVILIDILASSKEYTLALSLNYSVGVITALNKTHL